MCPNLRTLERKQAQRQARKARRKENKAHRPSARQLLALTQASAAT